MVDFAKCKTEGCNPIEQCRGTMGPGDYFGVRGPDGEPDVDHYLAVMPEPGSPAMKDVRIVCTKCFLATPWGTKDLPNMPGLGWTYCLQVWTQMTEDKEKKAEMIEALRSQFGDEALKKFFKHSL